MPHLLFYNPLKIIQNNLDKNVLGLKPNSSLNTNSANGADEYLKILMSEHKGIVPCWAASIAINPKPSNIEGYKNTSLVDKNP